MLELMRTMKNSRKMMLAFGAMLTSTFGILSTISTTTMPQLEVSAQNMTVGNNMTASENMTGTVLSDSGSTSSIAINEKGKPAEGKGR